MHDERIVGRPAFGFEYSPDRRTVERVGAKAVDGFGGKGNESAAAEALGRSEYRRTIGMYRVDDKDLSHGKNNGIYEFTNLRI